MSLSLCSGQTAWVDEEDALDLEGADDGIVKGATCTLCDEHTGGREEAGNVFQEFDDGKDFDGFDASVWTTVDGPCWQQDIPHALHCRLVRRE